MKVGVRPEQNGWKIVCTPSMELPDGHHRLRDFVLPLGQEDLILMLTGLEVLIAEDDPIIAMIVAEEVSDANGFVIGPFPTVSEALRHIRDRPVSAAIVDAFLADRDVTPLALVLHRAAVPFVIYSATGVPPALDAHYPGLAFESKPGDPVKRLARVLHSTASKQ